MRRGGARTSAMYACHDRRARRAAVALARLATAHESWARGDTIGMTGRSEARQRPRRVVALAMLPILSLIWFGGAAGARGETPAPGQAGGGYHLDVKGVEGQKLPQDVKQAEVHK